MNDYEKRSTDLLIAGDTLRKVLLEYSDLPVLIFAGEDANIGDWSYMSCSYCSAEKGEYLDCQQTVNDEKCYIDRGEFEEDLADCYANDDELSNLSDEEYNQFIAEKLAEYEPYWKDCIIVYVNN